ncbi:EF-P lysine aminoacylase EpmA [Aestuariirhabdus litorea]|uniref:EF-P lysine aminoacylase GenX n=1 Tax=Aestuariirhabdus litorea TaxID=2528527 RepID=A0A3P3VIZ1_9GAMM|nr:EF-P lysine aminoacylase EpmA [Aestuariirhabdus litorea]RRJ82327.1 EF-P lysine aminoacylase GenX [Aestuariirhabdus litorea]RWW92492.1 EF-P lysine aminoacylase GenX [Endozoicomonadaceae bacterium GTF-13]
MTDASWRPSAALPELKRRAQLLSQIRHYFEQQQVLEVETPMLSCAAVTDLNIDSFGTRFLPSGGGRNLTRYLHTSPEFPMKRLLAAGSGDIYQICRVFRNGEVGGRHNPEFTLLEWYRLGMDQQQLMTDMTGMLATAAGFRELRRVSYRRLFEDHFGINPHRVEEDQLRHLVADKVDPQLQGLSRNECLDLLFSQRIEPQLGVAGEGVLAGVYVYDYPASMAALARIEQEAGDWVARRFELFVDGLELANGYHELSDPEEQRQRFEADDRARADLGRREFPHDHRLLQALEAGLPDCAGVAIGLDRVLMLMAGTRRIADVLAFDFERA